MAREVNSNSILKAIDVVVNKRIDELKLDKTIVATIDKPLAPERDGSHKVQYNGGFFTAYSLDGKAYPKNTTVYVQVPQNDFSKKKIIVGTASAYVSTNDIEVESSVQNDYTLIGHNVLSLKDEDYLYDGYGLNSYTIRDNFNQPYQDTILLYDRSNTTNSQYGLDAESFQTYLQDADAIMLQADFRTALTGEQQVKSGAQYGLIFDLVFGDASEAYKTQKDLFDAVSSKVGETRNDNTGAYIYNMKYIKESIDALVKAGNENLATQLITKSQNIYAFLQNHENEFTQQERDIFRAYQYLVSDLTITPTVEAIQLKYQEWMDTRISEIINKGKVLSYAIDSSHMLGNPFAFKTFIDQYSIFTINKDDFKYIDKIYFYCMGFKEDGFMQDWVDQNLYKMKETDANGSITYHGKDIWVRDLSIFALAKIDSTQGDYTLKITTPEGAIFKTQGSSETLFLHADITYRKNIDLNDDTNFYWFMKDSRVTGPDSAGYDAYSGEGWRRLNNDDYGPDIAITAAAATNNKNEFLCVAVYQGSKDGTIILKTQQGCILYNNSSNINKISIVSDIGTNFKFDTGQPTLTCLLDGKESHFEEEGFTNKEDNHFQFYWTRIDNNGAKIQFNMTSEDAAAAVDAASTDTEKLNAQTILTNVEGSSFPRGLHGNQITYNMNKLWKDDVATFECEVFTTNKKSIVEEEEPTEENNWYSLGVANIKFNNGAENDHLSDYRIIITNGDQVFQYSESGVAPTLQDNVTPTDRRSTDPLEIYSLTPHLYAPDGTEVDSSTYKVQWVYPIEETLIKPGVDVTLIRNPVNDKIELLDAEVATFEIADDYDYTALNNQIKCIITYNGKTCTQDTNFLFTKIGNDGTNGTDYVAKIEIYDGDGEKPYLSEDDRELLKTHMLTAYVEKSGDNVTGISWNISVEPKLQFKLYNRSTQVESSSLVPMLTSVDEESDVNSYDDDEETKALTGQDEEAIKYEVTIKTMWGNDSVVSAENDEIEVEIEDEIDEPEVDIDEDEDESKIETGIKTRVFDTKKQLVDYLEEVSEDYNVNIAINTEEIKDAVYNFRVSYGDGFSAYKIQIIIKVLDESEIGETDGSKLYAGAPNNWKILGQSFQYDSEGSVINQSVKYFDLSIDEDDCTLCTIKTLFGDYLKWGNYHDQLIQGSAFLVETGQQYYATYPICVVEGTPAQIKYIKDNDIYVDKASHLKQILYNNDGRTPVYNYNQGVKINNLGGRYIKWIATGGQRTEEETPENDQLLEWQNETATSNTERKHNEEWPMQLSQIPYSLKLSKKDETGQSELDLYGQDMIYILPNDTYDGMSWDNNVVAKIDTSQTPEQAAAFESVAKDLKATLKSARKARIKAIENENARHKSALINYDRDYSNFINDSFSDNDHAGIQYQWNSAAYQENELHEQNLLDIEANWQAAIDTYETNLQSQMENFSPASALATFRVPLYFCYNTYGLASLNAWDGNSIDINDNMGYIVAPQIGAGIKDRHNRFTGIVMGREKLYNQHNDDTGFLENYKDDVGLLGYSEGRRSIFLNARDGSAIFGLPETRNQYIETEEGKYYTEGRIELRPGGISKICGWKMGSRFLFNAFTTEENRKEFKKAYMLRESLDEDSEEDTPRFEGVVIPGEIDRKTFVQLAGSDMKTYPFKNPYPTNLGHVYEIEKDYQGIMISALPAYIAIKGKPLKIYNGKIPVAGDYKTNKKGKVLNIRGEIAGKDEDGKYMSPAIWTEEETELRRKIIKDQYDLVNSDNTSLLKTGDSIEILLEPNSVFPIGIYRHYYGNTFSGKDIEQISTLTDEQRNAVLKTKHWCRTRIAGINVDGNFYSGALEKGEMSANISWLPAFQHDASEKKYRGFRTSLRVSGTDAVLAKMFCYYPLTAGERHDNQGAVEDFIQEVEDVFDINAFNDNDAEWEDEPRDSDNSDSGLSPQSSSDDIEDSPDDGTEDDVAEKSNPELQPQSDDSPKALKKFLKAPLLISGGHKDNEYAREMSLYGKNIILNAYNQNTRYKNKIGSNKGEVVPPEVARLSRTRLALGFPNIRLGHMVKLEREGNEGTESVWRGSFIQINNNYIKLQALDQVANKSTGTILYLPKLNGTKAKRAQLITTNDLLLRARKAGKQRKGRIYLEAWDKIVLRTPEYDSANNRSGVVTFYPGYKNPNKENIRRGLLQLRRAWLSCDGRIRAIAPSGADLTEVRVVARNYDDSKYCRMYANGKYLGTGDITTTDGHLYIKGGGKNIYVEQGDIYIEQGDMFVQQGNATVKQDITVQSGNITVSAGNITASAGNITSGGDVSDKEGSMAQLREKIKELENKIKELSDNGGEGGGE